MNYLLLIILLGLFYFGLLKFRMMKEQVVEVEHSEPEVDQLADAPTPIPLHRYGLFGEGERKMQLWCRKMLNEAYKEGLK